MKRAFRKTCVLSRSFEVLRQSRLCSADTGFAVIPVAMLESISARMPTGVPPGCGASAFFAVWASLVQQQKRLECRFDFHLKDYRPFSSRPAYRRLCGVQEIKGASLAFFAKQETVDFAQAIVRIDGGVSYRHFLLLLIDAIRAEFAYATKVEA